MSGKSSHGQGQSALLVWISLVICLLFLSGCEDEPVQRDYPRIRTLEVTNITGDGATFVAEVTHEGTVPITEHGFAWALSTPDINRDEIVNLGSFSGKGRFDAQIGTALKEGLVYEVCAFVKAGDYTVYGDKAQFMSLGSGAPEIIDFIPKSAGWGDTISITGRQFSYRNFTNRIFVEDQECIPFASSDTLLRFVLPPTVIKSLNTVSVNLMGNLATAVHKLNLIAPEVYGFVPVTGYWGDTVIFTGCNLGFFGLQQSDGMILNDNLLCKAVKVSGTSLSFLIPGHLNTVSSLVSLSYKTFRFSFPQNLNLRLPEADSIFPLTGTWKSVLTLYGKFNPVSSLNTVLIGNVSAVILSSSTDSVKVEVPVSLSSQESAVTYKSDPYTTTFSDNFILAGPEFRYFTPAEGCAGTLMKIGGRNLNPAFTEVFIGGKKAHVESGSDSVINCYVPGDIYGNCNVIVKVLNSTINVADEFRATNHRITSVAPVSVSFNDIVTVRGEYFDNDIVWSLGDIPVTPFSVTSSEVKFQVPARLSYSPTRVNAMRPGIYPDLVSSSISDEALVLKDFVITYVGPTAGKPGDLITIEGTDFALFPEDAELLVGDRVANISFASHEKYVFIVPGNYEGEHQLTIKFLGKSVIWPQPYMLSSSWKRLDDLTFLYDYGCVFDLGEEAFVATMGSSPTQRTLYRFEPARETFIQLPGTYASQIKDPCAAGLGGRGYLIGNKENPLQIGFEVFNPDSLSWRALPDYPGSFGESPWIVADDTVIYAGSGKIVSGFSTSYNEEFWKYSPLTGRWTRLADIRYGSKPGKQAYINGRVHAITPNNVVSIYDASTDRWDPHNASAPYQTLYFNGISAVMNGKWYVGYGDFYGTHFTDLTYLENFNDLMAFDPVSGSWSQVEYPAMSARSRVICFTIGDVLYTGGDQNVHLYDFYRYDPLSDR
jgi:hypothetical protein